MLNISDEAREALMGEFLSQAKSTQYWVDGWNRFGKGADLKNAMFAIGRIHGQTTMLQVLYGGQFIHLPKVVQDLSSHFSIVHDELSRVIVEVKTD